MSKLLFHTECSHPRFIWYNPVIIRKYILVQPVNWWNKYAKVFALGHLFNKFSVEIHIKRLTGAKTHRFGFHFVEQNFSRPYCCFWSPVELSENRMRSSDHKTLAMISLVITISTSLDKYKLKSDMYFRNINPLEIPPWLTPILLLRGGLSFPFHLTRKCVLRQRLRKVSITLPFPSTAYQFIKKILSDSPYLLLLKNQWSLHRNVC